MDEQVTNLSGLILSYIVILISLWVSKWKWRAKPLSEPPAGLLVFGVALYFVLLVHAKLYRYGPIVADVDPFFPHAEFGTIAFSYVLYAYIALICVVNVPWRGYWKMLRIAVIAFSIYLLPSVLMLSVMLIQILEAGASAAFTEKTIHLGTLAQFVRDIDTAAISFAALIILSKLPRIFGKAEENTIPIREAESTNPQRSSVLHD